MTTLQTILVTALIAIWLCISVGFLVSVIQSAIYDRKREKREQESATRDIEYRKERDKHEQEQAARDEEYHQKRMEQLNK